MRTKIMLVTAQGPARKCVTVQQQGTLPTVCMQSNNMAIPLYTRNGRDISDACAKLSHKNCK